MKNLNNTTEVTLIKGNTYKLTKVLFSDNYVVYFEGKEYIHGTRRDAQYQIDAIKKVNRVLNNKYNYLKVIQQNCGFGWEDVSEYEAMSDGTPIKKHTTKDGKTMSLYKHDLKEYIFSNTGATRGIFRKELKK